MIDWQAQKKPDEPKSPPPQPRPDRTERLPANDDPERLRKSPGIEPSEPWPPPGKKDRG